MRILDDRWSRPLLHPDVDAGTPETSVTPPAGGAPDVDREPSPRGGSIRDNLEHSFREARRGDAAPGRDASGRFTRGGAAEAGADGDATLPPAQRAEAAAGGAPPREKAAEAEPEAAAPAAAAGDAPKGWAAEAKAAWATLPPAVQAAVTKREQDMAAGVQQLQSKYADLDQALHPHLEAIRSHGRTPAQAVDQLFKWFQALGANPDQAFPALAQSFGYDLSKVVQPAQPAAQPGAAETAEDVPPAVKRLIAEQSAKIESLTRELTGKVGGLENTLQSQTQAKTEEFVNLWAKDKPHFEQVRGLMAQLIASGAVPLTQDGRVDLDGAYDRAVYAHPEVREQLLTARDAAAKKAADDRAKAEREAQAAQANNARRASSSLAPGAPGSPSATQRGKKPMSVRESLMTAIEEVRG